MAWPTDVEDRVQFSKGLSQWAPGLIQKIVEAIRDMCEEDPRVKAVSKKQQEEWDGWRRHLRAGHLPHRRDCVVCLEGAGRDRPHRKNPCPDSYVMGVDLMGPYPEDFDQEMRHARYAMVCTVTVPYHRGTPLPESLQRAQKEGLEPPDEEDYEPSWIADGDELQDGLEEIMREEAEEKEEPSEEEGRKADECQESWRKFLGEAKSTEVKTLTLAVPLQTRKSENIVEGLAKLYSRVRALQIPIHRLHTHTRPRSSFLGRCGNGLQPGPFIRRSLRATSHKVGGEPKGRLGY